VPDEAAKTYLCARLDRASRWVYFEILPDKGALGTQAFRALDRRLPVQDRENPGRQRQRILATASPPRANTSPPPPFDQGCFGLEAEHRLIPPRHPRQRHGRRCNGRIAELLASTRFSTSAELTTALGHYQAFYNERIPHLAPIQALKAWREKEPERFVKEIYNLTVLYTFLGAAQEIFHLCKSSLSP
jgi:hypothetical protein